MPEVSPPLDRQLLQDLIRYQNFKILRAPTGAVGAVMEWMLKPMRASQVHAEGASAPRSVIDTALERYFGKSLPDGISALSAGQSVDLPNGGAIRLSSGGQIRYTTPLSGSPLSVINHVRLHVGGLVHKLEREDLRSVFQGMDPWLEPHDIPLHLTNLRQRLLESYLEENGDHGLPAMRCSCVLQVNLHPGVGHQIGARLAAAERLAPLVAAVFANSPLRRGRVTQWVSRRLYHRYSLDPLRTRKVGFKADVDPISSYCDYALAAPVILKDDGAGGVASLAGSPSFGDWLSKGHEQGPPTILDWQTHLSTLYPPVVPNGTMQVTAVDAQAVRWFPVPLLLWWALLWRTDPAEWLAESCPVPEVPMSSVAEKGIRDPSIVLAVHHIYDRAQELLKEAGQELVPAGLLSLVSDFRRAYLDQGRMPADDLVDRNTPPRPRPSSSIFPS